MLTTIVHHEHHDPTDPTDPTLGPMATGRPPSPLPTPDPSPGSPLPRRRAPPPFGHEPAALNGPRSDPRCRGQPEVVLAELAHWFRGSRHVSLLQSTSEHQGTRIQEPGADGPGALHEPGEFLGGVIQPFVAPCAARTEGVGEGRALAFHGGVRPTLPGRNGAARSGIRFGDQVDVRLAPVAARPGPPDLVILDDPPSPGPRTRRGGGPP
jgi:hypothetical protein